LYQQNEAIMKTLKFKILLNGRSVTLFKGTNALDAEPLNTYIYKTKEEAKNVADGLCELDAYSMV